MLFNTWSFGIFLMIVFCVYYIKKLKHLQVFILVLASLVFYAFDNPTLVFLLLASALLNTIFTYEVAYGKFKKKKLVAVIGVSVNLLLLIFFKYGSLVSELASEVAPGRLVLLLPLPIGISFFTFEGISLLVDVYSEKYHKRKQAVPSKFSEHVRNTLFFISFFPHLVSGPILKAHEFLPQISSKRFQDIHWNFSLKKLILGFFLKVVIADNLAEFTWYIDRTFFVGKSTITLIVLLWGYSIQIFADFAGYSLIAIGLAALFGYRFPENFNFPYIATSFSEFWKRWHISLSSFLREYLYIPMGGNRKGKARMYLHLFITMVLGGLWHGSSLRFAAWGLFHGILLAGERIIDYRWKSNLLVLNKILTALLVFNLVSIGWIFFKLTEVLYIREYFVEMYENFFIENDTALIINIALFSLPVIGYHLYYLLVTTKSYSVIGFQKISYLIYGFLLWLILLNAGPANSFIYFQF